MDWGTVMGSLDKSTENALAQRDTILNMLVKSQQAASLEEQRKSLADQRAASAEDVRLRTADRLKASYAAGDDVTDDPEFQSRLQAAGLGNLIEDKTGGAAPGAQPSLTEGIQQAEQVSGEKPRKIYKGDPKQRAEQQRVKDISDMLNAKDPEEQKRQLQKLSLTYGMKTTVMQDGTMHLYQVTPQGVQDLGPIPGLTSPKIIQQSASTQMGSTIDPNAADMLALDYMKSGKQPSMGRGGWGSPLGQQVAEAMTRQVQAGLASPDLATNHAAQQAAKTVYTNLARNYSQVGTSATIATKNLDLVLQANPDVSNTDSAWVNQHMQDFLRGASSSPGLTDYEVKIYTAAREYAKVVTGSSASVAELSAAAVEQVSNILNSSKSPEARLAAVNAMKQDMANITGSNAQTLIQWQDAIKSAGTNQTGFGSQGGNVPGSPPAANTPPPPPPATGIAVRAPNGKTYLFPTQDKADEFRKRIGGQ